MNLGKKYNSLCSPAHFYLVLSLIVFALVVVQNLINGNIKELCIGSFSCGVPNLILVFLLKLLYIAFWTFVLDALCKYGLKQLSWFLVLFPFILLAVIFGLVLLKKM